jgi:hypothetical protein
MPPGMMMPPFMGGAPAGVHGGHMMPPGMFPSHLQQLNQAPAAHNFPNVPPPMQQHPQQQMPYGGAPLGMQTAASQQQSFPGVFEFLPGVASLMEDLDSQWPHPFLSWLRHVPMSHLSRLHAARNNFSIFMRSENYLTTVMMEPRC